MDNYEYDTIKLYVDFYRFWYAAYYEFETRVCPRNSIEASKLGEPYVFKGLTLDVDRIAKHILSLFEVTTPVDSILKANVSCSFGKNLTARQIIENILNGTHNKNKIEIEEKSFGGILQFHPSNDVLIDETGKIVGHANFTINMSTPPRLISYIFSKIQDARFTGGAPEAEISSVLSCQEVKYMLYYSIIKDIKEASFDPNKPEPRAIGLLLFESVYMTCQFENMNQAITRLLMSPEDFGLPRNVFELLGYTDVDPRTLSRWGSRTVKCIKACEVLKMA